MSKLSKSVSYGKEFQQAKDEGVEAAYQLAKVAYGPNSFNVAIELNYGYPTVSHDGVTNLRKLNLKDPNANMAARIIVQASEKNNKMVGDGTTGVAILAYHFYQEAKKLIAAGHNAMQVKRLLEKTAREALEAIDQLKTETTPALARAVSKIAASDAAIGDMVADVIERIGVNGNPIVEEFDGTGSYDEEVNGFYFPKGFSHQFLINNTSGLESRMQNVDIFITEKPLKTQIDIKGILDKIYEKGGEGVEFLIIGEVTGEALETLLLNKAKGIIQPTLVDVHVHGQMRSLFLEDIALYTGGKVFPNGAKASSFNIDMMGSCKQVVVKPWATTLIEGEGAKEDIDRRVHELREQVKETENLVDREEIGKRIATLTGKIAIIHVGAPTEVEKGEIGLRVEDAIAATQSALRDGIVPGGGVALAHVQTEYFAEAFKAPFRTLVDNAGYNYKEAEVYALGKEDIWLGYNLRDENVDLTKPKSMLKLGVIDPAEVVKEEIRNAASVVGILLTMGAGITFIDRTVKVD
jgi:chaperonin GroEL